MAYRKPQRRQVNPRTLRKHSQIVHNEQVASQIIGFTEKTATGYRVEGATCSQFEVYTEVFIAHSATNTMKHDKKSRAYRVLSGQGILVKDDNNITRLQTGVTVQVEPGEAYRVVTVGEENLEVIVVQAPKYEARLYELDTAGVSVEASATDMHTFNTYEDAEESKRPRRRLSGSKAKAQMSNLSSAKKAARDIGGAPSERAAQDTQVVNAAPSKIVNGELVA